MVTPEHRIVIKRYANRRFYEARTGSYLTVEEIVAMAEDEDLMVQDAGTGEDITDQILAMHRLH